MLDQETKDVITNLPDLFLQQLAVAGISGALNLEIDDVLDRTNAGNDLCFLRVDVYAYLYAWLVCSVNYDTLMSISSIPMRHKGEGDAPDKEIYQNVFKAIAKRISEGKYAKFAHYPDNDPLSLESARNAIIDHMTQLVELIQVEG